MTIKMRNGGRAQVEDWFSGQNTRYKQFTILDQNPKNKITIFTIIIHQKLLTWTVAPTHGFPWLSVVTKSCPSMTRTIFGYPHDFAVSPIRPVGGASVFATYISLSLARNKLKSSSCCFSHTQHFADMLLDFRGFMVVVVEFMVFFFQGVHFMGLKWDKIQRLYGVLDDKPTNITGTAG